MRIHVILVQIQIDAFHVEKRQTSISYETLSYRPCLEEINLVLAKLYGGV